MSLNAYQVTFPVMDRGLNILDNYVDEAARLAEAQGRPVEEILTARLAPDMLSFAEQITVLCRKAERHAATLGKQDRPDTPAGDPTIEGLKARIRTARAFVQAVPEADVLGAEARPYQLSEPLIRGWLGGSDYILGLVLPDFFFHQTMAHAILRHLGSEIGKRFYLGHLELDSGGYD
jgi:hypothetical protein